MRNGIRVFFILIIFSFSALSQASQAIKIYKLTDSQENNGLGEQIGVVELEDTPYGLKIHPKISGLTPGQHGFHIHENGSCAPKEKEGKWVPGLSAGGHFDPKNSGRHSGPFEKIGHLGDLPVLCADDKGRCHTLLLAPKLTLDQIQGRAMIIHDNGDNFSDDPKPLGGGGNRVACGLIG